MPWPSFWPSDDRHSLVLTFSGVGEQGGEVVQSVGGDDGTPGLRGGPEVGSSSHGRGDRGRNQTCFPELLASSGRSFSACH